MKRIFFLSVLALASSYTMALAPAKVRVCQGFLPKNNLWIPDSAIRAKGGLTHAQFDEILDRVQKEYSAEVSSHGAKFYIERNWDDGEVNAYAYRQGNVWTISMFGGFARYPTVTYDGFAGVACHETGHHLGGAPIITGDDWAAVEGGADYYSMLKCLRRIFLNDDNKAIMAGRTIDPFAVTQCQAQHDNERDQWICIRSAMAALNLGQVLAELDEQAVPNLNTPDPSVVSRTFEDHPAPQCRVDTLFNAALCKVPFTDPMSKTDYRQGSCYAPAFTAGVRPLCWFKP
jgi:hypothetical protein